MSRSQNSLAREKLRGALKGMLDGSVSFIEGSRIVSDFLTAAGFDRYEEPFVRFVAIASETDGVPIGDIRKLWHPEAVIKHTEEWARAESWAMEYGEAACSEALAIIGQLPIDQIAT